MDDIKEKIKQALRHIWINKYRLFFCLLTLCCLFGLVHYFKSADSATASRRRVTRCFVISWVSSFFYLATPHNLAFAGYFSPNAFTE